jgi:hypothetical protein
LSRRRDLRYPFGWRETHLHHRRSRAAELKLARERARIWTLSVSFPDALRVALLPFRFHHPEPIRVAGSARCN